MNPSFPLPASSGRQSARCLHRTLSLCCNFCLPAAQEIFQTTLKQKVLAVAAVAARRDGGNHPALVARAGPGPRRSRASTAASTRRRCRRRPRRGARVAAADVDVAGAPHDDAAVGAASDDVLAVVASGGDDGGGQDGDDGGGSMDHSGLMRRGDFICSFRTLYFAPLCVNGKRVIGKAESPEGGGVDRYLHVNRSRRMEACAPRQVIATLSKALAQL